MALNDSMRGLLGKEWTTMMVANNHKQGRNDYLRSHLQSNESVRWIMDYSQRWSDTPQGHTFWARISMSI